MSCVRRDFDSRYCCCFQEFVGIVAVVLVVVVVVADCCDWKRVDFVGRPTVGEDCGLEILECR